MTPEDLVAFQGVLSPDGKTVLFRGRPRGQKVGPDGPGMRLYTATAGAKPAPLADVPLDAEVQGYCWSPDGKRIAYTWRQVHEGTPQGERGKKETASHLVVCDADGKNARTLFSEKGIGQWHITVGGVDWR